LIRKKESSNELGEWVGSEARLLGVTNGGTKNERRSRPVKSGVPEKGNARGEVMGKSPGPPGTPPRRKKDELVKKRSLVLKDAY